MAMVQIKVPDWVDRICAWPVMVYRKRKYGYDFRRIHLGQGIWTILDQEDYYRYGHIKWCLGGSERKSYAIGGIRNKKGGVKTVYLHREIMKRPKKRLVDHKNRDSLDNRRANLRLATHAQNSCNKQKRRSKTTSRFIGISYEKGQQRWVAKVKYEGKSHWVGGFKSEIEAAKARDKAAKKYHGEFSRLNFPESDKTKDPGHKTQEIASLRSQ